MIKPTLIVLVTSVVFVNVASAQTNKTWDPGTFPENPPCNDCYVKQAEIMVPETGIIVSETNPVCSPGQTDKFAKLLGDVLTGNINSETVGDAINIAREEVYKLVRPLVGGDFGKFLDANGPRSPYGNCAPLIVAIPASATIRSYRLGAWDEDVGASGCHPPPGECVIGWSKFLSDPKETTSGDNGPKIVSIVFNNWKHDRDRVARLFVFFTMPSGKKVIKYE